ncbi:MAG: molybdenum cofactor guanylyltransferase [Deltaproteobacteria bacterium]|nr:MAG: molybdenum cofactor guanylyltransferase [Deltaproteobacteria bacterium]
MQKGNITYPVTGVILAGGKSKRIGINKAFIEIAGKPLISIIIDLFSKIFKEVIISSNQPELYTNFNLPVVPDLIPNSGSIGGIYTGLTRSSFDYTFFSACDMPFLNEKLIRFMLSKRNGFDVIIPKTEKGFEPTHAIYSKNCIKPIKKRLDQNILKIIDFLSEVKVKTISIKEIKKFDPTLSSFFNINTIKDLKIALKRLE